MVLRRLTRFLKFVSVDTRSLVEHITWFSQLFSIFFSHTHTHTHTHIYIYIIEHNRYFLSTYFFVNPLELPYWSYDSRRELVDKSSIISYFPSTFWPTLDHHQGRMYNKSDVTFVCSLLLCKNERLYCYIV